MPACHPHPLLVHIIFAPHAPQELLQAATINCAQLFMMDDQLGRVQAGFKADLLLIGGDPLQDISLLTRPQEQLRLIMKGGRVVKNTLPQPKGGRRVTACAAI